MLKKCSLQCLLLSISVSWLCACQAPIQPATLSPANVAQSAMKVNARESSFIYLTPIPKEYRTVYIAIQNDSGSDVFNLQPWLEQSLQQKSFIVVHNLDQANVVLRANLLRIGNVNHDDAQALLDSGFGNSTQFLSLAMTPGATGPSLNNTALVLDLQYFDRKIRIDPTAIQAREAMAQLTDIQLLLLCNTRQWERFQTRIVAIIFGDTGSLDNKLQLLGQSAAQANADVIRGLG